MYVSSLDYAFCKKSVIAPLTLDLTYNLIVTTVLHTTSRRTVPPESLVASLNTYPRTRLLSLPPLPTRRCESAGEKYSTVSQKQHFLSILPKCRWHRPYFEYICIRHH